MAISFCNARKKSWRHVATSQGRQNRTEVVNSHLHPLDFDAPRLRRLVERTLERKIAPEAVSSLLSSAAAAGTCLAEAVAGLSPENINGCTLIDSPALRLICFPGR